MKKIPIILIFLTLLTSCAPGEHSSINKESHLDLTGGENDFLKIVGSNKNISTKYQEVIYYKNTSGYLVRPDDDKIYPGIILIHEWWGLNENMKDIATTLAKEGYVVLAVDLYNGVYATTTNEAKSLVESFNQEEAIENMKSAISYLRNEIGITKIASMGFCFGGKQSAQLSISDATLDATIIYYGHLPKTAGEINNLDAPILGIFGELDTSITPENVNEFKSGLEGFGIQHEIIIYENVGHAFLNTNGERFAKNETKDAWIRTLQFLEAHLNN